MLHSDECVENWLKQVVDTNYVPRLETSDWKKISHDLGHQEWEPGNNCPPQNVGQICRHVPDHPSTIVPNSNILDGLLAWTGICYYLCQICTYNLDDL